MTNPIKVFIRWWDDPDNRGKVIFPILFILFSGIITYCSGSIWIGLLWFPGLLVCCLIAGIVLGLPLSLGLYVCTEFVPKAWDKARQWAYR